MLICLLYNNIQNDKNFIIPNTYTFNFINFEHENIFNIPNISDLFRKEYSIISIYDLPADDDLDTLKRLDQQTSVPNLTKPE